MEVLLLLEQRGTDSEVNDIIGYETIDCTFRISSHYGYNKTMYI